MVALSFLLFSLLQTHFFSFTILPCLHFPTRMAQKLTRTEIDALVAERDQHRAVMNYIKSDEIKMYLTSIGVEIFDISYKCEGNSKWTYTNEIVDAVETNLMTLAHEAFHVLSTGKATESEIVTKAMEYLNLQSYGMEVMKKIESDEEDIFVESARTVVYKSSEMNGRKYVDAAFEFCMAGVSDPVLFAVLADFARNELIRFGNRSSCKPLPILQMIEKLAVSGVRDHDIFSVAKELLQKKGNQENMHGMEDNSEGVRGGGYNLFSRRPLLWLWRYATKQKKPTKTSFKKGSEDDTYSSTDLTVDPLHNAQVKDAQAEEMQPASQPPSVMPSFAELFVDPSLPLVLDLGCGYGVPLLNLCDQQQRGLFARCNNYLGVDLSDRAIRYASGISKRWGFSGTCAFVYADCQAALAHIHSTYPGPVVLIMVNFPTPYGVSVVLKDVDEVPAGIVVGAEKRKFFEADHKCEVEVRFEDEITLADSHSKLGGNTQLPDSFDNFMVNHALVQSILQVLSQRSLEGVTPAFFLQSNVEDVVVTMSNIVVCVSAAQVGTAKKLTRFAIDEIELAMEQIFKPAQVGACSEGGGASLRWRTPEELQRATSGVPGTGRMSRRLHLWLETLAIADTLKEDRESASVRAGSVVARKRAAGPGWLASTPLPGNARTETEVHCDIEKQPVHRTVFLLK